MNAQGLVNNVVSKLYITEYNMLLKYKSISVRNEVDSFACANVLFNFKVHFLSGM